MKDVIKYSTAFLAGSVCILSLVTLPACGVLTPPINSDLPRIPVIPHPAAITFGIITIWILRHC